MPCLGKKTLYIAYTGSLAVQLGLREDETLFAGACKG